MSLENSSLPILPEQLITPVIQEDFWAKVEKELLDHYKIPENTNTTAIKEVAKLLSQHTEEPSQLNDVITILKSFPYPNKEDITILYSTLLKELQDSDELEFYATNPLLYIQNKIGTIKTKIEKNQENKINQEIQEWNYKKLRNLYESNKDNINNSLWNINKSIIIERIPKDKLEIFREAFWYKTIQPEKPGETPDYEAWMNNDSIDNKIAGLVNYYATLHDKIEQSKTNPKIKVTADEKTQAENFTQTLQSLSISPEEFYGSINIIYVEPQEQDKSRWYKDRWYTIDTPTLQVSTSSSFENKQTTNLSDLRENFKDMNSDNMITPSIFSDQFDKPKADFDKESLLAAFPLPSGTKLFDFALDNKNLIENIKLFIESDQSHPLIESSTKNKDKQKRAKKALINYLLHKANPSITVLPDTIAHLLYPPKKNETQSWIQKVPKEKQINKIEEQLLIPLMQNNFCGPVQEQYISQEIKKWYMNYIVETVKNTPSLQEFYINPKEINLSTNTVEIPLHLNNSKQATWYLIIEDGKIRIKSKNDLYNPQDTDSNNQISKSKKWVYVGTIKGFSDFSEDIINNITQDTIKNSLSDKDPRTAYQNNIQEIIIQNNKSEENELNSTSAGIAHILEWSKVQDSIFTLMKSRSNNGNQNTNSQGNISQDNPFYTALRDYEIDPNTTIQKYNQPEAFDTLNIVRNTILKNSAYENQKFSNTIETLQQLITDKTFNDKLTSYLSTSPIDAISERKHIILQTLKDNNRASWDSLVLLLQLFGTNPMKGKEQYNTINTENLIKTINQLQQTDNFDLINFNISQNNPIFWILEQKYGKSADEKLSTDLNQIEDSDKIQTIVQW